MPKIQMDPIPEPAKGTASVLIPGPSGPQVMFKGVGEDTYICGACEEPICENVQRGQMVNLVFKCYKCGSYNRVRGS